MKLFNTELAVMGLQVKDVLLDVGDLPHKADLPSVLTGYFTELIGFLHIFDFHRTNIRVIQLFLYKVNISSSYCQEIISASLKEEQDCSP